MTIFCRPWVDKGDVRNTLVKSFARKLFFSIGCEDVAYCMIEFFFSTSRDNANSVRTLMLLPGNSYYLCVPDYVNPENHQAFLDLMAPEDRLSIKSFDELKAIRDRYLAGNGVATVTFISVPVKASRWKEWCESRQFELTPVSVAYYAQWLHLCTVPADGVKEA